MTTTDDRSTGRDVKQRVLFLCMGNICRSPLAEGVFVHLINARRVAHRYVVDSAGTGGWHAGELPDRRSLDVAKRNGIQLPSRARQVTRADLGRFDWFICMDEDNRENVLALGAPEQRVRLLLDFDPGAQLREVPDPYYGGEDGFELVYRLVSSACAALLDHLEHAHQSSGGSSRLP